MAIDVDIDGILTAIVWPVFATVVLILVIVNRQHLAPFIKDLRISKVSFGNFLSLDFAELRAFKPDLVIDTASGAFDLRNNIDRPVESSAQKTLIEQIKEGSPGDFAIFDLGNGKNWLSSRLFLFTIVFHELYGLKSIVFVYNKNGIADHFLGITEPREIRYALAKEYPWLESSFGRAYITRWQESGSTRHIFGSLDQGDAIHVVINFLKEVQKKGDEFDEDDVYRSQWINRNGHGHMWEHAEWMTIEKVEQILGESLDKSSWINESELYSKSKEDQIRLMLSFNGRYVAILDHDRRFEKGRLIDKQRLATEAARHLSH